MPPDFQRGDTVTIEQFETLALNIFIPALILYMLFILYKLKEESGAGGFGFFVIFLSLGMGIVGFVAKTVIQVMIQV